MPNPKKFIRIVRGEGEMEKQFRFICMGNYGRRTLSHSEHYKRKLIMHATLREYYKDWPVVDLT